MALKSEDVDSELEDETVLVFSKIDRVLVNDEWVSKRPDHFAHYAPEGDYDHCPCFIRSGDTNLRQKRSFKFFNMWTGVPDFLMIVKNGWHNDVLETRMYKVVRKLKMLKTNLKGLNKYFFSDIERNSDIAHELLLNAQRQLHSDPHNTVLRDNEYNIGTSFQILHKAKMEFLRQKAKCEWARDGDSNSAMFHKAIRQRQITNKVLQIEDINGQLCNTLEGIMKAFLDYYQELLGVQGTTKGFMATIVSRGDRVQQNDCHILTKLPNKEEIKNILFDIPDDKSPGPDGYSSCFFKAG
ncbi:uncharacterized protein LOC141601805 [Silene latifolia]|uniref:uncharacterized protein LOC141601805 n=1 Tax=Silene latifolia TaxID=37657 RepID=UPI003D775E6E